MAASRARDRAGKEPTPLSARALRSAGAPAQGWNELVALARLDELREAPLAGRFLLRAHHPEARHLPIRGHLGLEELPRAAIVAQGPLEGGIERPGRALEGVGALRPFRECVEARRLHPASLLQLGNPAAVVRAPLAAGLSRREADQEMIGVQALPLAVDPADAERFVDGLF